MEKEPGHNRARAEFYSLKYNRSFNQVLFLLELMGYDYPLYEATELAIYNNGIFTCPSTMLEVKGILDLKPKKDISYRKKSNLRITFASPILGGVSSFKMALDYSAKSGYHYFVYLGTIYHISGESTGISEETHIAKHTGFGWIKVFNSPILPQLKEPKENSDPPEPPALQKAIDITSDNGYEFFNWRNHLVYGTDGKPTKILTETLN